MSCTREFSYPEIVLHQAKETLAHYPVFWGRFSSQMMAYGQVKCAEVRRHSMRQNATAVAFRESFNSPRKPQTRYAVGSFLYIFHNLMEEIRGVSSRGPDCHLPQALRNTTHPLSIACARHKTAFQAYSPGEGSRTQKSILGPFQQ
jgi:hypothetical protein